MVLLNADVVGVSILKAKDYPPWAVDLNGVLACPIASEFMPGGAHNYGWSKDFLGAAFDLAKKQKNEFDYDKRQTITHDWQKAMAENMPTIPVQGERSWTQFSLAWPKLQNYKSVAVNGPDGVYGVLYENYWYDKSKDKA